MDLLTSSRSSLLPVTPDAAWARLVRGGPGPQWYAEGPLAFRQALDRLLGGVAPADPPDRALARGDRAFFWQVRAAEPFVLDLEAQVRAPGRVTLRSALESSGTGCRLTQRVRFEPAGLLGTAYLLADLPAREVLIEMVHRQTRVALSPTGEQRDG